MKILKQMTSREKKDIRFLYKQLKLLELEADKLRVIINKLRR